jgi:dihydrofolate reductase
MGKLIVFNHLSADGFFVDAKGTMEWAHHDHTNDEWNDFVSGNMQGGGTLLFGRVTYELMIRYWPTPLAAQQNPLFAERMNSASKVVFSRTMDKAAWNNTKLFKDDLPGEVRKMKHESAEGIVILGSGTIASQLAQENLIDEYQFVLNPVLLGKGRTLFEGLGERRWLKLTKARGFSNGNVFVSYEPAD